MKIPVLFLLVSTANFVVGSNWNEITFPPEILLPDLEAIENYFVNINNNIVAFVHWPNDISFVAYCDTDSGNFIKILGTFIVSSEGWFRKPTAYDGLYFKNRKFYVKSLKEPSPTSISDKIPVSYSQKELPTQSTYLSIRYFGLDEIKKIIEPFRTKYQTFFNGGFLPSLYLATTPNFDHFIEYSTWDSDGSPRVDGKLRVLIGTAKDPKKLILSDSVEAPRQEVVSFPDTVFVFKESSKPLEHLENVFGVRMATKGVLTEVHGSKIRVFNSDDLSSRKPKHDVISARKFMAKVKVAEPQHLLPNGMVCFDYENRPDSAYFQVLGHVLEKKVHFVNGEKDKDCPLVIEYATKESNRYFWYGNKKVEKLCTDDCMAWPITSDEKTEPSLNIDITLTYPEY